MKKKPKRARTERRETERAAVKLAEARLRLAAMEEGGSAERPVEVMSASVIEPHAAGLPCAACGHATRVEEHTASADRRIARVRCKQCGVERNVYFRIMTPN